MTQHEALVQLFGSASAARQVLKQRRAIAEEAMATADRLQKKLLEGFPPVDSAGASLNATFESELWTLMYKLKQIHDAIAECDPKPVTGAPGSGNAGRAKRVRRRRKP
jgi:hypothetical protein